ncbi:hypothetical protein EV715DRAFT_297963 [Schizophyllum commune]
MSAPAELLSHDYSPSPLLCSRRTFLATKFTLDKCYSCRARFRRRRTCNAQGLVGLDVLIARCHRTCQPPRRALDVVVVPAGPWRVGGDESRARSGAERRCARLFACASEREILANRRQMRRGPRPTLSLIAATVERGMGAARSAADGADTEPFSAPLQRPKKCEIDVNCAEVRAGSSR